MTAKEKKISAALAGVAAYLQQEEESFHQQMNAATAAPTKQAATEALNLWGQSGRQSMMQLRNLMQIKGLHRHA